MGLEGFRAMSYEEQQNLVAENKRLKEELAKFELLGVVTMRDEMLKITYLGDKPFKMGQYVYLMRE